MGVLKDYLHAFSELSHLLGIQVIDSRSLKQDLPFSGFQEPQNYFAEGRFTAPGFTDQPKNLSFSDKEGHIVHSLYITGDFFQNTGFDRKVFLKVPDFEQIVSLFVFIYELRHDHI